MKVNSDSTKKPGPDTAISSEAGNADKKADEPTKKRLIDICREGGATISESSGGRCAITGMKPQMTVIDLNELEAGQPNWLSVIAKQKAEAKREAHKKKLLTEAKVRFQERRKRERKKGDGP